ncbi:hypothetical protein QBC40DRAFT_5591 [Triangularia verruculosa]|uniref:Uncharacterized protein n=1 Tax=Triangularia verruculosa TaxID=2587418 RepID=A0AAN6X9Y6_9PEZI|nr:hypothetical protein QBC40DRAFT_5591 [Triangularia verruculosa]
MMLSYRFWEQSGQWQAAGTWSPDRGLLPIGAVSGPSVGGGKHGELSCCFRGAGCSQRAVWQSKDRMNSRRSVRSKWGGHCAYATHVFARRIEMRCRLDIRSSQTKHSLDLLSGGRAPVLARSLHEEALVGLLALHWRQLGYENLKSWTKRIREAVKPPARQSVCLYTDGHTDDMANQRSPLPRGGTRRQDGYAGISSSVVMFS